jgi:hypothetical protein
MWNVKNRSGINNNKNIWIQLQIIQKVHEQHTRKGRN